MDKETKQFEADLLASVAQARRGEGRVTTAETIKARRGRPPLAEVKVAVKLRLDPDVVQTLRDSGPGWQTRANDMLRASVFGTKGRRTKTRADSDEKPTIKAATSLR